MKLSMSVIIPTHDTQELTLRCLDSVARAELEGLEVVVVDDGSVDQTVDRVRERFPNTKVVRLEPAGGFTVAANAGLREASGELLFLLNSDAEIEADTLSLLSAAFNANPRLGAAGARLCFFDGRPQWSGGPEPSSFWILALATGVTSLLERLPGYRFFWPQGVESRRRVAWVSGAAMVIRRSAWLEVGMLDERFGFYCQDLDYCLRLSDAGWEVAAIASARVFHHGGGTIRSRAGSVRARYNPELLWTDLVRFFDKRHGERRARSVARLLEGGGRVRVLARRLRSLALSGPERERWDRDTAAFGRAIKGLAGW